VRPDLTDVTRAWSILEHFRRNWIEPLFLGCSMERYEEITTYDQLMAWLDERPEHANSDLGMFIRMSLDIGLENMALATASSSRGAISRMKTVTTTPRLKAATAP
jgi:hypothetical protein